MHAETKSGCPFCHPTNVLIENDLAIVIPDRYPVSRGHVLLIPRRHAPDIFVLTAEEREALWGLLLRTREYLEKNYRPAGYNIGVNCGPAAGQSIEHVHIHVIPRYQGDVPRPRGGVRGIIPAKRGYSDEGT